MILELLDTVAIKKKYPLEISENFWNELKLNCQRYVEFQKHYFEDKLECWYNIFQQFKNFWLTFV